MRRYEGVAARNGESAAILASRGQQHLHRGAQPATGTALAGGAAPAPFAPNTVTRSRSRTALLLIDFMNPLDFDGGAALGRRALPAAMRTAALKARLARKGVPAIYCNDNFGHWESEFRAVVEWCRGLGGAPARLAALLAPQRRDHSVLKPRHSAFFGTPLEFLLAELRVSRLVLTGLAADNCIVFTAHDAYLRQYRLWVPADCVASERAAWERNALAHLARVTKADVRAARRPR
jgi:nicotinamidase-related amidase